MKKITIILLLGIYSLSTLGLSLKSFYCCGKLESVKVTITQDQQQKHANDDGIHVCCKTKYQFFKVKDNHISGDVVNAPILHFCYLHLLTYPYQGINYSSEEVFTAHLIHGPPLHHTVPDYIFNCVFRI